MKGNKSIKSNNEDFSDNCDCPICKAMQNGKTDSFERLLDAFEEAKRLNPESSWSEPGNFRMTMRTQNKDDIYYDAMELLDQGNVGAKQAEKILKQAILLDENYVQTHIGLANVYGFLGNKKKLEHHVEKAFSETVKKFPKWPKSLPWGDVDNRAYLRSISYKADILLNHGEKDKAIEMYRLLLKINPNDNQGTRYLLAGIYSGLNVKDINKIISTANKTGNWNKLEKLVSEQNKIHKFLSKEFNK